MTEELRETVDDTINRLTAERDAARQVADATHRVSEGVMADLAQAIMERDERDEAVANMTLEVRRLREERDSLRAVVEAARSALYRYEPGAWDKLDEALRNLPREEVHG
jgi:hypothetical protein